MDVLTDLRGGRQGVNSKMSTLSCHPFLTVIQHFISCALKTVFSPQIPSQQVSVCTGADQS